MQLDSRARQLAQEFPFPRILCFGDSLTVGVTARAALRQSGPPVLSTVEGYVPKLARLLTEELGEGFVLGNAGVSNESTAEGLDRLDNEIRRFDPDLILLLEGVIDVNNEAPRFFTAEGNLAEMLRIAQLRQVAIIIGTMPPLNPDGFRTRGAANIPRLNDIIREEASAKGVLVADHEKAFAGDLAGQGPDGLHPNNIGYQIMAETWLEAIVTLAERAP